MSHKGECWDNAFAESFFTTIKRELVNDRAWPTRAGLTGAVITFLADLALRLRAHRLT